MPKAPLIVVADHRVLNGRESIGFLTRLKGALALLPD